MHIAILGRQPALGMAELEQLYPSTTWFSDTAALVDAAISVDQLGGSQKTGTVVIDLPRADWRAVSDRIVRYYQQHWADHDGKITLGISAYGFDVSPRDVQRPGLVLKQRLKKSGMSVRLIPNTDTALTTATSHHNKLGLSDNKVELLVARNRSGRVIVAESTGAQNITAYAKRDQQRPKRDAFVGMLPPKLAQMMINMARPLSSPSSSGRLDPVGASANNTGGRKNGGDDRKLRVLDPFCGTGVVLQEAALMGYRVYGTDLSDKMIDYTRINLEWLADRMRHPIDSTLAVADAMTATWQPPVDMVVCEGYLGQPFSAPPSPSKLAEVSGNCNHIISTFLSNLAGQITPGTPVCVAVPAWRTADGSFHHLPLIRQLDRLGYTRTQLANVDSTELLYYRPDQIVARELLIMTKT